MKRASRNAIGVADVVLLLEKAFPIDEIGRPGRCEVSQIDVRRYLTPFLIAPSYRRLASAVCGLCIHVRRRPK